MIYGSIMKEKQVTDRVSITTSIILCIAPICLIAAIAESAENPPSYQQYGLYKIPASGPASQAFIQSGAIKVQPVSVDDVNESFSNIDDLAWLKPHARHNQAIFLGENHYYKYISNLRNRIFFAINQWDYYPTIVLEGKFSASAYAEHFLSIQDEQKAADFAKKLSERQSDYNLLMQVYRWNRLHPEKPLRVAYSDIEHGCNSDSLIKYLQKADPNYNPDMSNCNYQKFKSLYPELKERIAQTKAKGIVWPYPTTTADYYAAVLENLLDAYKYYSVNDSTRLIYRQKAIVRNLTDDRFLGRYINKGKFMLHGGAYHMDKSNNCPDGDNFMREGSFFEHEYSNTKGKTYSIRLTAVEYSLGAMADVNLSLYNHRGGGYGAIFRKLQGAYKAGAIEKNDSVANKPIQLEEEIFAALAANLNSKCLRVVNINWGDINTTSQSMPQLNLYIKVAQREFEKFDTFLFIPRSPILELMPK